MSNQVEVNNNTIDEGLRLTEEEEGNLVKNERSGSLEIEELKDGKESGVKDEKVEISYLKNGCKLEESRAEEVEMKTDMESADERDYTDAEKANMVESTVAENAKEGSLENMQVSSMEEIERPSFDGEVREIEVTDESSTEMSSVVEFSSSSVKTREEEDEVSRLLAALRALCTSTNTDVVLLCFEPV